MSLLPADWKARAVDAQPPRTLSVRDVRRLPSLWWRRSLRTDLLALALLGGVSTLAMALYTVTVSQPDGRVLVGITIAAVLGLLAGGARATVEERRRLLSRRLLHVQELERRTIARELHDEVGQALTAIKINLQSIERSPKLGLDRVQDSLAIVEALVARIRDLSLDLRPAMLDDWGLYAAVRWYAGRQAERAGITIRVRGNVGDERLPSDVETTCFRVVQEAVTNALRHARATRLDIRLSRDPTHIGVEVVDDGAGFDVHDARHAANHGESLGLLGMEERVRLLGGEITLSSRPGAGTTITVSLPTDGPTGGRPEQ